MFWQVLWWSAIILFQLHYCVMLHQRYKNFNLTKPSVFLKAFKKSISPCRSLRFDTVHGSCWYLERKWQNQRERCQLFLLFLKMLIYCEVEHAIVLEHAAVSCPKGNVRYKSVRTCDRSKLQKTNYFYVKDFLQKTRSRAKAFSFSVRPLKS